VRHAAERRAGALHGRGWRTGRRGVAVWRSGWEGSEGQGLAADWHSFRLRHIWRSEAERRGQTGDAILVQSLGPGAEK
jgi:hypothetical protein